MKKLCSHPGCHVVFNGSGFKCPIHRPVKCREPNRNMKFYNSKGWKTLSQMHRQEYPICEWCNRNLAVEVDHHLEIENDELKEFCRDDNNLVSVCKSCHITKGIQIRKLTQKGNINALRNWLIQSHPRTAESDYLKMAAITLQSSGD
ncbi:hypothetical protein [Aeromonas popoffii]|uniref:hypothetical protein n=1 Tax=Aeromonas popoffii TaxID=70856 RepID=UPI0030D16A7F